MPQPQTFYVLARVRVVPREGDYNKHDAAGYLELAFDSALKDTDARDGVEALIAFDSFEDLKADADEGVLPASLDS